MATMEGGAYESETGLNAFTCPATSTRTVRLAPVPGCSVKLTAPSLSTSMSAAGTMNSYPVVGP